MDTWTAVFLLNCFLFAPPVQSAPVASPTLEEMSTRAMSLVEKVLEDIPAAHSAAVSIQTSNLEMMELSLDIPAAPVLKKPSKHFTRDTCVGRMSAGVQLYQNLLAVLAQDLGGLEDLRSDLRDLLTHINKLKEAFPLAGDASDQNLDPVSPHLDSYRVQAAAHFTLTQLRSFGHDLIRTFKILDQYSAAGAR